MNGEEIELCRNSRWQRQDAVMNLYSILVSCECGMGKFSKKIRMSIQD